MPILIHSYSSKSNNNTAAPKTDIIFDQTAMGDNKNQRFVSKFEEISLLVSFQRQKFWACHEVEGIK